MLQGPDIACAAVARVGVANQVDVLSCSVVGTDVLVEVSAHAGSGPLAGIATGRARPGR